jgi:hypothetical protein
MTLVAEGQPRKTSRAVEPADPPGDCYHEACYAEHGGPPPHE